MKYLLFLFLMIFYVGQGLADESNVIKIATGEYAPFVIKEPTEGGIVLDLVKETFNRIGKKVEFTFMTWKRVEKDTEEGKYFAAIPYTKTDEREKRFYYSDIINPSPKLFFYKKNNSKISIKKIDDLSDLKGMNVGGVYGNWYEEDFKEKELNVVWALKEKQLLKIFITDRVDMFPANYALTMDYMKKNEPEIVDQIGTINYEPYNSGKKAFNYLMVSKKYPDAEKILEEFNTSLEKLKKSDEFKDFFEKYGLEKLLELYP